MSLDPLSLTYTEIWRQLAKKTDLASLVRVGNRIRFDNEGDPSKTNISHADTPEVLIVPETISPEGRSSSSYGIVVTYAVITTIGDFRYTDKLAKLEWLLICLLLDWKDEVGTLTYKGERFILKVELVSASEGIADIDPVQEGQRKKGWTSLLRFDVHMMFSANQLP